MSDIGLNISQLHILLRMLHYKLGANSFEIEYNMKELRGETVLAEFGEYSYIYEDGS